MNLTLSLAKGHFQAFIEIIRILKRYRNLTMEMAKRELSDRYAGQSIGVLWAIIHPVFMMALYVFIFAVVFKQKVGGTLDMPFNYTTYLLSGLVCWLSFQEALSKSCVAITSNSALVKQVVFPLEVLPVKTVIASLFPMVVSLIVLIVYVLVSNRFIPLTYLLLPILVCMQVMFMIGISFLLAPIGAYFRDLKDIVQLLTSVGAYTLPVFYLPAWVPGMFKPLLYVNPFSHFVWCYQDLIYFARFQHPWSWLIAIGLSCTSFLYGYLIFRKLKPMLGNAL